MYRALFRFDGLTANGLAHTLCCGRLCHTTHFTYMSTLAQHKSVPGFMILKQLGINRLSVFHTAKQYNKMGEIVDRPREHPHSVHLPNVIHTVCECVKMCLHLHANRMRTQMKQMFDAEVLLRRGKQHSAVRRMFGKKPNAISRLSVLQREFTYE